MRSNALLMWESQTRKDVLEQSQICVTFTLCHVEEVTMCEITMTGEGCWVVVCVRAQQGCCIKGGCIHDGWRVVEKYVFREGGVALVE